MMIRLLAKSITLLIKIVWTIFQLGLFSWTSSLVCIIFWLLGQMVEFNYICPGKLKKELYDYYYPYILK